ncbi:MAG TPA: hypothetical protein VHD38_00460 [Candidatus Paceibacterota bacterium]|jgi:hypothetical protein|nr:hypothetical protein [Candidatus Paceibacterota bacterium]
MANVLPEQDQKKLWRALRARFIIVLSVLLIVLALIGYFALIPSYLALQFAAPPTVEPTAAAAASAETTASIGRAQAIVLALAPVLSASTTPSSLISEALAAKPSGVTIDHISYDAVSGTIMLSGSGSRDTINSYRDLAAKDANFSDVSVPVSALVGESGHFSMTITLAH